MQQIIIQHNTIINRHAPGTMTESLEDENMYTQSVGR